MSSAKPDINIQYNAGSLSLAKKRLLGRSQVRPNNWATYPTVYFNCLNLLGGNRRPIGRPAGQSVLASTIVAGKLLYSI